MRKLFLTLWGLGCCLSLWGQNKLSLQQGWDFHFAYDVRQKLSNPVINVPHTWNAGEVAAGKMDYTRTAAIYKKTLPLDSAWKDKRLFLYFEGVNSVADVFIDQQWVGNHKGGYTAFCFEITPFIKAGKNPLITVQVSNEHRLDVLPLTGDFNVYGGIHRPVWLLIKEKNCISPLDFASSGVYVTQYNVSEKTADVFVKTKLSLIDPSRKTEVRTSILDAQGKTVAQRKDPAGLEQKFTLEKPHLWNARQDPYLYRVKTELLVDGQGVESQTEPLGIRSIRVDANEGFFLNGKKLDLHGFGYHEDVSGKGSAYEPVDYLKDMDLVMESGATSVRLTHYPHGKSWYELSDEKGLILWSEIPLVGPGGYTGMGYIKSKALEDHARQVMQELIRQHYNHPSICFWGLFNELKLDYDDPVPFLKELNQLVKTEDSTRITTCASFLDRDTFNEVSDVIAWNKYYGWYGGSFEQIGSWADQTHRAYPAKPIAVSEYGAGASIRHHQENLQPVEPTGRFHPEEWQTAYHEKNWEELRKRPFIWGKYVWVLADFGSSIRTEGDQDALNDKGLVTYDRNVRKDAFYFYKANWNTAPMLYLAERRNVLRQQSVTTVKVFTTLKEAELWVNGVSQGRQKADDLHRMSWPGIQLKPGKNRILVKSGSLEDTGEWYLKSPVPLR
ncbi:glycoside hydrolase family 2 TIM barrel-domain containing protein [Siphonobacter sp. SORGH_AS_1065]|uniref:glycoside hydrolase family 2 protein n=1 Tax=Siphonobacter sp. SORGH_AS_1065 TaxID=3041795 RepID=UPI002780750E|nr:glycoside hydrolase family 2 TIM barrel-domain containing protein [Siphonobacter sp. SORGH_AS_1065]MDQ1090531.1 beta-galactosidase [Siphonobacter sp. SORGH_AS_1065]